MRRAPVVPLALALLLFAAGSIAGPGAASAPLPHPGAAPFGPSIRAPSEAVDPWSNLTGSAGTGPPGSVGAVLVNDTAAGYDLWFGGSFGNGSSAVGQTWTFANGSWTNLTPDLAAAPPARTFAAAAYEANAGIVVLFGGLSGTTYRNDTWIFSGGNWSDLSRRISSAPSPRAESAMTYDASTGTLLLYGGEDLAGPLGDTWSFSGGTWSELAPTTSPPAACCGALAYDSADSEAVLVLDVPGTNGLVTWTYSGEGWTNATTSGAPLAREWPALVDDPAVAGVVLYGGTALGRSPYWPLGDAWIFSAGRWSSAPGGSEDAGSPGARWDPAVAPIVPSDGCFLLVGGAGTNGSVPLRSTTWSACGNRTDWTTGTGTTGPGPNPPVVQLVPSVLSGVVPFETELNVTVRNGTPPFRTSICTSTEGCVNPPAWNGSGVLQRTVLIPSAGTYSVSAVVIDAAGLSGSASASVVGTAPMPLAVAPTESPTYGTEPLSTQFGATVSGGQGPYEVQWNFGDGSVAAGVPGTALTHIYDRSGTFAPTLVVTDALGTNVTLTLTPVVVAPVTGPGGNGGTGPLPLGDQAALAILVVGLFAAVAIYAIRRRRLTEEAEATYEELGLVRDEEGEP